MAGTDYTDDVRLELHDNDTDSDTGFCTLQVRTKRGTGTRDQDRITGTLARPTLEGLEAERDEFLELIEDTVARTRAMDHDEEDEDDASVC